MANSRDLKNQRKGYQEALIDIAEAMDRGGEAEVVEWIKNNGDEHTRTFLAGVLS